MHTYPPNTRLAFVIATLLSLGALPPARAAENYTLDIPAQPLADALSALSLQSGTPLSYEGDLAKNIRSPAVKGAYTTGAALDKLLAGTGLGYRRTGNGAIIVAKQESRPAQQPANESENAAPALPTVKVTGQASYDANDPYNPDYNRPNASTATKTDTPIMETPVSIQVVPQQVLKDQQAINLQDALKNVSGIVPQFGFSYREGFLIRGFVTRDTQRRDGFLVRESRQPLANVDRVEVLKGPAAILYGNIEPGGLINLVTKRPQTESYYSLSQQFGSFDTYPHPGGCHRTDQLRWIPELPAQLRVSRPG